ncbi:uncharacterized protein LOC113331230 isoform X2 [Papaver somniferum]|uniref:uncharacterized protein LOC113331230 isoform X2 n=2 Tax=Papaver somniferum TaxID=3469 RepID=UPI000E701A0C|nr:uncharacterized protein LOC113331230 isoform X2 [Papaver somniferum]
MMNQLRMLWSLEDNNNSFPSNKIWLNFFSASLTLNVKMQGLCFPSNHLCPSMWPVEKTSLNPRAERKNCGRSSRWEGYFSSNKPMKQISVLRMTLAKLWVHMVWSLKNERQEAENMFSSKQAEEEAKKESTQTFISGEVPDVIETSENDKVAKSVAPTPEQIIAIKAAIVNSQTLENVASFVDGEKRFAGFYGIKETTVRRRLLEPSEMFNLTQMHCKKWAL